MRSSSGARHLLGNFSPLWENVLDIIEKYVKFRPLSENTSPRLVSQPGYGPGFTLEFVDYSVSIKPYGCGTSFKTRLVRGCVRTLGGSFSEENFQINGRRLIHRSNSHCIAYLPLSQPVRGQFREWRRDRLCTPCKRCCTPAPDCWPPAHLSLLGRADWNLFFPLSGLTSTLSMSSTLVWSSPDKQDCLYS